MLTFAEQYLKRLAMNIINRRLLHFFSFISGILAAVFISAAVFCSVPAYCDTLLDIDAETLDASDDLSDESSYEVEIIESTKVNPVIKKIYRGLNPGGILILSEKLAWPDQKTDDLLMEMYWDFKRRNGYSELEISQKRNALENVLIRTVRFWI